MDLWESDLEFELAKKLRRERHGPKDPLIEEGKRTLEVVNLLSKGKIHRAVDQMNSFGVANLEDPSVMDQMVQKYPER